MERKEHLPMKTFICFVVAVSFLVSAGGLNAKDYKPRIYSSYINGNMAEWERVVKEMGLSFEKSPANYLSKKELVGYYYGLTGYLVSQKEKKRAAVYVAKGDAIIESVLSSDPDNALFLAYKAAFMGFKIGINNLRAMTLGMKSADLSSRAFYLDSANAQVVSERANVLFYSPSFAGGNKKEAMRLYGKAIELIEKNGDTLQNWFYLSLLTNMARLEEQENNLLKALSLYKKILAIEPRYKWVRNELLPSLQSRL
ncbi:MAG: hypothetical protein EOM16_02120 [Bacteroidia bacterium]|nr:hypothetical protein [Bacteroidia bacterium]